MNDLLKFVKKNKKALGRAIGFKLKYDFVNCGYK